MNQVMPKRKFSNKNNRKTLEDISIIKDKDLDEYIPANNALLPYFYWWAFAQHIKHSKIPDKKLTKAIKTSHNMKFSEWLSENKDSFESIELLRESKELNINAIVALHDPYKKSSKEDKDCFDSHIYGEIYLRVGLYWSKKDVLTAINEHLKPYYNRGYRDRDTTGNYFDIDKFRPATLKNILIALMIRKKSHDEQAAIKEIIERLQIKMGTKAEANGGDAKKYQIDTARRFLRRADSIMNNMPLGRFPVYK